MLLSAPIINYKQQCASGSYCTYCIYGSSTGARLLKTLYIFCFISRMEIQSYGGLPASWKHYSFITCHIDIQCFSLVFIWWLSCKCIVKLKFIRKCSSNICYTLNKSQTCSIDDNCLKDVLFVPCWKKYSGIYGSEGKWYRLRPY